MRRTLLTGLGVVLVLVLGGAALLLLFRQVSIVPAQDRIGPARVELVGYLDAVQRGDTDAAYGRLCLDALKAPGNDRAAFAAYLAAQPRIRSFSVGQGVQTSGLAGTYVTFPVHLSNVDGTVADFHLDVGAEKQGMKVCDGPGYRR